MESNAYAYYLQLLACVKTGEKPSINAENLLRNDGQTFTVTVKNYRVPKGLSMRINECQGNTSFEVQGPMGKGLQINNSGLHIAFTAGTGCLVFVDLVAHLIRKNIGVLD